MHLDNIACISLRRKIYHPHIGSETQFCALINHETSIQASHHKTSCICKKNFLLTDLQQAKLQCTLMLNVSNCDAKNFRNSPFKLNNSFQPHLMHMQAQDKAKNLYFIMYLDQTVWLVHERSKTESVLLKYSKLLTNYPKLQI